MNFRLLLGTIILLLCLAYGGIVYFAAAAGPLLAFSPFAAIGLFGALVANSTGVGGGVVFVPAFSMLRETGIMDVSPAQTIGVSFAIQCFGMTTGSLTWLNRYRKTPVTDRAANGQDRLWLVIALVLPLSLASMLATQYLARPDPLLSFLLFKIFSIGLGTALLLQLFLSRGNHRARVRFEQADYLALATIGLAGGVATALFSVGVGELMALYLFLRRFPLELTVASAVIVSAISVVAGVPYHLLSGNLVSEILLFAAPAVVLGGFLAPRLAVWLGAFRLKLGAGLWIVISSAALIAMSLQGA
ncbi:sulfite exporter TauE/SafE family protein [Hyphobacterium sp. HN65]|uniref:Probable membrane transporter protein n=1 Tax=Hyphobacterium lacteum TaxID=3116575 RepID=A0ABU7LTB9_9PROT|nr:sulfite exporter TauE/SafE family protein [Hyphobacterium sp. HN65]MEE2526839.1 sulfite exporter TauE/SafE family protein [Hyphobacterium sp. HN65]